jgi:hypothetical protein
MWSVSLDIPLNIRVFIKHSTYCNTLHINRIYGYTKSYELVNEFIPFFRSIDFSFNSHVILKDYPQYSSKIEVSDK